MRFHDRDRNDTILGKSWDGILKERIVLTHAGILVCVCVCGRQDTTNTSTPVIEGPEPAETDYEPGEEYEEYPDHNGNLAEP